MSTELVPYEAGDIATNGQLDALMEVAETTQDPHEAHELMVKGRIATELLQAAKQPFENAQKAGKVSTLAARKLGLILETVSNKPKFVPGRGSEPSERGLLQSELGLSVGAAKALRHLARIPDPDFQRYIQSTSGIPSPHGAVRSYRARPTTTSPGWQTRRRRSAGVKTPKNPNFDEGYNLIVLSLGHLTTTAGRGGNHKKKAAIGAAIGHLYAAEELLKPYRGGYVK